MEQEIKNKLNNQLEFFDSISDESFLVSNFNVNLLELENKIQGCLITFDTDYTIYQKIRNQELFNLKSDFCLPNFGENLSSQFPINIEAKLNSDFLSRLVDHVKNNQEATNYIIKLSKTNSNARLINTQSWLLTKVRQKTNTQNLVYSSFWDYLDSSTPEILFNEDTSQALARFFKETFKIGLQNEFEKLTSEIDQEINNIYQNFDTNESPEIKTQAIMEMFGGMSNELDLLVKELKNFGNLNLDDQNFNTTPQSIFEVVENFLEEDEWPLTKLDNPSILQTVFQGDNGKWSCYAQVREIQRQLIFYSIAPINVEENKRLSMAEFITRINYILSIGNFELDFDDGEIRYRTSISLEENYLDSGLVKQLIYTNVLIMDKYLPSIMKVIYSDKSVENIITEI